MHAQLVAIQVCRRQTPQIAKVRVNRVIIVQLNQQQRSKYGVGMSIYIALRVVKYLRLLT